MAWSFYQNSKKENGINKKLMWACLGFASGHLWSMYLIIFTGPSLQATLWRNVQLLFEGWTLVALQYYVTKKNDNRSQQSGNTPDKKEQSQH